MIRTEEAAAEDELRLEGPVWMLKTEVRCHATPTQAGTTYMAAVERWKRLWRHHSQAHDIREATTFRGKNLLEATHGTKQFGYLWHCDAVAADPSHVYS